MSQPYSVKECLHGYTEDALGVMCERWHLVAKDKSSRIRALEKVLCDPLHTAAMAKQASPSAVRLLRLIGENGTLSVSDILRVPGLYTRQKAPELLREIAEQGLVLVCPQERSGAFTFAHLHSDRGGAESSPLLFVPDLTLQQLRVPEPMGIELPVVEEGVPAEPGPATDRSTAFVLETLRIVELLHPRVTAGGTLHRSDLLRAQDQAREAALPVEAFSLSLMVTTELGCVETKRGRLVTTEKAAQWAEQPRADRMRDLVEAFLAAQELPDIKLFFPQIFEAVDEHLPRGSVRRTYHRLLVARILREQPEGAWHGVEALCHTIFTLDRNVLFLDEQWRAIQANTRDTSPAWKDRQWQMREKRLFAWMIQSLFRDLGLVELSPDERLFRVTPVGRYALGVAAAPQAEGAAAHDALVVQPDFEIIVYLDRCPPTLRRTLDTFCERVQGGMVSTYRLTQDSVYRGVRSGMPIATFVDLLEKNARRRIPPTVRDRFASWERKLESVRIHAGCNLIECGSAAEADSVLTECNGSKRIGERYILLHGAIPTVDLVVDYRLNRRPCLQQESGLVVRVPWEKSDLFVRRYIEELGTLEKELSGDWLLRLSETKIKHVEDWGLHLAQLEALAERPLAGRYRMALRAWSGELETAGSRTVTLVRLGDPDTCSAITEFEDVAQHIEGRLGLNTLVVKQGELAKFKAKLKSRGIVVKPADNICDEAPPEQWAKAWIDSHQPAPKTEEPLAEVQAAVPGALEREDIERLPSYSTRIVREIIEDAVARRRPILIEYQSAWSDKPRVRRVDPVAVDTSGATPALSGYCHLREGARVFKLAQISGIRVLEDESF